MIEVWFRDLLTLTTDNDMRVKASDRCRVIRVRSEIVIYSFYSFCNFIRYALLLPYYLLAI